LIVSGLSGKKRYSFGGREDMFEFSLIFIFLAVGLGFVFGALLAGAFIRPKPEKQYRLDSYECGERPIGSGWYNFNPRFYMLALIFLLFDVEIVVTYPVIVVLRSWAEQGKGWLAFSEIGVFILILMIGFIFLWSRGDLEWIKSIDHRVSKEMD
jgi:NADH-quinone oxidoreductase subunit A